MTIGVALIVATTIYKLACLGIGGLCCAMGYQLFSRGIWGSAGDFESKFKDLKIVLRGAAPGSFFALLGAAIVVATVSQGMKLHSELTSGVDPSVILAPALPEPKGDSK